MRRNLLILLGGLLTSSGLAYAQNPPTLKTLPSVNEVIAPAAPALSPPLDAGAAACFTGCRGDHNRYRVWVSVEYIHWSLQGQRLSAPVVVTTTDKIGGFRADDFATGNFTTLYGPGSSRTDNTPGFRGTAGMWLDSHANIGLELSGFRLSQLNRGDSFFSDNKGTPFLAVPFILQDSSNQVSVVSAPKNLLPTPTSTDFTGSIDLANSTQLWGIESNGVLNLRRANGRQLEGLVGIRYLNLEDTFAMQTNCEGIGNSAVFFNRSSHKSVQTLDSFATRNQFYGGQLGLRGSYDLGRLQFGLSAKVALGSMHEQLDVRGSSVARNAAGAVTGNLDRGYFAMPNNSGSREQDEFCVIPEVEGKIGYALTRWLDVFVGYDYLHVSRVARAASQLDSQSDSRLQLRNAAFNSAFTTNVPSNEIRSNSFWAHGISAGVQISW